MLVRQRKLCRSEGKVLCNGADGAQCQARQTKTHIVPRRAILQLPGETAELRHPLKTAYSAGIPRVVKRFTTHLELWWQRLSSEPSENASQCTENVQR